MLIVRDQPAVLSQPIALARTSVGPAKSSGEDTVVNVNVNDADRADSAGRPFRILLVCEANVCRSPLAEYLLRKGLSSKGADTRGFELSSAGTHAYDGA